MKAQNVLLLQGPYGPLFSLLSKELMKCGCGVHQIAVNGGDQFYGLSSVITPYRGDVDGWSDFVAQFVKDNDITDMVCFSDCRVYHKAAKEVATKYNASFWVLEEGYLRPDYFTLERGGVNALSEQNLSLDVIREYELPAQASPYKVKGSYVNRARFSAVYYIAKKFKSKSFPLYLHHRARTEWQEFWNWRLSDVRKLMNKFSEKGFFKRIADEDVVVLVLQMHEDFQLREHSPYSSMMEVINEVMTSFAENADKKLSLVIKHHPMDRGFHHYGDYIAELQYSLSLQGRVHYVHDVHLPTLLRGSKGVVTVNSTVGLSAVKYGCPVKVLGEAIYDLPEITYQGGLDVFWQDLTPPNAELVGKLVAYLRNTTQFNGSLHKDLDVTAEKIAKKICRTPQFD